MSHICMQIKRACHTTFIKDSCSAATYPRLCYTNLSIYASEIKTSPKALATRSLFVALIEAQTASRTVGRLSRTRGLRPKEVAALSDCTAAMASSAAQLQRAVEELGHGGPSSEMVMSDVQTWTSTALTYAGTCIDGFEGRDMDGNVKIIVRRQIMKVTQLNSNALALVNSYGSSRKAHHQRHNNP
ncbi:hypothetical protein Cgig2_030209 [Carnegiea gigantea]|uniref:Pectinesterase inhibitor domain-containing protein n=1 Tax=Carnegiea gigantea TaxID=171969 RepID=A0A9Q1QEX9_9CARY|nr:hypothetical protein Cgig2_030209 [Carnegiea gigantea]